VVHTPFRTVWRTVLLAAALVAAGSTAARAQLPDIPDPDTVRGHLGPLLLNPTVSLVNAGIDTNVFNEADGLAPKSDATLTLTPASDWWMRMGRAWITGRVRQDMVWYQEYASERSFNQSYAVGLIAPLNRLTLRVGGTWADTRERPGFEIDARADRREHSVLGAVELRALARTRVGLRGERRQVEFDDDALFLGSSLRAELNRTITNVEASLRHDLTPLTSVAVNVGVEQERFEFSPLRDADSARIGAAVYFDPFALISGSAQFGYRRFSPLDAGLPGYAGTYAAANLTYVALGSTRVGAQVSRDVQYSYDVVRPYYLQTGVETSLAQQVYGPVDVEGRFGYQRLSYRQRAGEEALERIDRVRSYGTGAGYRIGRDLRVGVNVDWSRRTSILDLRGYDGMRYGVTVVYGVR
jgi:hypothetical protein